jgi:enoyl-CoA hydratase
MNTKYVSLQIAERVGMITIDSPPANSLSPEVRDELHATLRMAAEQKDVWNIVITGAGDKFFMAGANISSLLELDKVKGLERVKYVRRFMDYMSTVEKPIIAAINGICLGGGLEIALCCDIRITADHAVFGLPEVGLGIMPGAGGTQRLPRAIAPGYARYLIFTGGRISAAEALQVGIVEKVVPAAELMSEAMGIAQRINKQAPLAVRAAKKAMNATEKMSLAKGLDLENELWGGLCETQDKNEGILAFLEKRKPRFQGI